MKTIMPYYKYFWEFVYERQNVFFKRLEGAPPPWSNNHVLQKYKFTNVYRISDRVSQYLIKNVIYNGKTYSKKDMIFRILLFKIFNKIETWEKLEKKFGDITFDKFEFKKFDDFMSSIESAIFSNAYMMCTNRKSGLKRKYSNYLKLIENMFETEIDKKIINSESFENVFKILNSYIMIGGFLAYQFTVDLNYSEVIDFSENDFVEAGGGTRRGIRKCFVDAEKNNNWNEVIKWVVDHQDEELKKFGYSDYKNLFGRKLHYTDIANCFCETDKFTREMVKGNDLEVMKRIKTRFTFDVKKPKIEFAFPPKWKLEV